MSRPGLTAVARTLLVLGAGGAVLGASTLTERTVTLGSPPDADAESRIALTATTLTCPGPELTGVTGVDDVVTSPLVTADTAPASVIAAAEVTPRGTAGLRIVPLVDVGHASPPDGRISTAKAGEIAWRTTVSGPLAVVGQGSRGVGVVGAQESLVTDSRAEAHGIRGLVSTTCMDPTADAWLAGGGSGAGRQERLLLVNAGANPATAEVVLHGSDGPVDTAGGKVVTVPAHGRAALLLDALAPDEKSPVVQIRARSGLVGATLVDTWVDGVTPRGLDASGPAAVPALRQLIPAVAGPGAAVVRVAATGTTDAVAQVRLITRQGRVPLSGGSGILKVPAGATRDVAIPALPKDVVGVEVVADQPVVAAAMSSRSTGDGITDFGWSVSVPALRAAAGTTFRPLAVGDTAATRTLSLLASGGRAEADITLVDADGVPRTTRVRLASDTATTLDVSSATSVWVTPVTGGGQLRAGVVTSAGTGADAVISVRSLVSARFAGRDLPVVQARQ